MKTRTLILGIGAVLVLAGTGVFSTVRQVFRNWEAIAELHQRSLEDALDTGSLVFTNERAGSLVKTYLMVPSRETLEQLADTRREFDATFARMEAANESTAFRGLFETIDEDQREVRRVSDALIEARRSGASVDTVQKQFERELLPLRRELYGALSSMQHTMRSRLDQEQAQTRSLLEQEVRLFALSLSVGVVAMLGLIALLVRGLRQQRRRERALQLSETKFASIITLATDAIISIDRQQRITVFNRGAEQTFGYKASEVLGQPLDQLLPSSFVKSHARHVEDFVSGNISARYMGQRREILGVRKGGEQFPAEASISKIEVQGEPLMTVVLRDISERRQSEHEARFLASAAEVLAESLDSQVTIERVVHMAVPELADCCALYLIREQALVLAGLAHGESSAGRQLHELLTQHPIPLEAGGELARSLQTGRCYLQELLPTTESPAPKPLAEPDGLVLRQGFRSQLCVPLRVRSRNIGALLLLVGPSGRRLGEREMALAEELGRRAALALDNTLLYAEAQSATRSRDEMLGIVAHDLRSPVNTLALSASVMLRRMKKQGADADQLHGVEVILQSTRRMNRLIEDLLDVVRMEAGRLSIQRSRWPVAQLVRDAAEAYQAQCTEAHVELKVELPEELPVLQVDADRIQQVLANLLGNALKFTPAGGTVTLGAALEAGSVVFHVTDSGPGMPPEHLAHVFDRFWQARSTDRRGAGLGLAIAKGIVEAHGGRIWARSKPGEGSTFCFALPLMDAESRSEPPAA